MEQKKTKTKLKYDVWFIMMLGIMLWTLIMQLTSLISLLPSNWANYNVWLRTMACGIAIYGVIWVFRIYLSSIIKQARKIKQLEEALKEHPEIKAIVNDILKG